MSATLQTVMVVRLLVAVAASELRFVPKLAGFPTVKTLEAFGFVSPWAPRRC